MSVLAKYIQYYGSLMNRTCDIPLKLISLAIEQFSVDWSNRTVGPKKSEL